MNKRFDYKSVLLNYSTIVKQATSKKRGLKQVKADWEKRKKEVDDVLDINLVEIGIFLLEASKRKFDMQQLIDTGHYNGFIGVYDDDLFKIVNLFEDLVDIKERPEIQDCLNHVMSLIEENFSSIPWLQKDEFFNKLCEELKDSSCFLENFTLGKLFELELDSVLRYEEAERRMQFDCSLTENELILWHECLGHYNIVGVMKCLYYELFKKIKYNIFSDSFCPMDN